MNQPVLTIIAGSNGCGKSTLTSLSRDKFQVAPVLDPDAVAKSLQELSAAGSSDMEAGKQVLRLADTLLTAGQSFTVETTLSGTTYLRMAVRAKEQGFLVMCILIGTTSVEINIERIKGRVLKGGHDIQEKDQRRRYSRTLENMRKLLPMSDFAIVLDNSTDAGHILVGYGLARDMRWNRPLPSWAEAICC